MWTIRPVSDADLFLSSWKDRRLKQLRTVISIWNGSAFFSPGLAENFDFGTALERLFFRRRTFHVPNQMHKLHMITYFESETENVLGTAVEWLLSSASETTGVLLYIWVGPNSN